MEKSQKGIFLPSENIKYNPFFTSENITFSNIPTFYFFRE